ncbi:MAG: hypothetical protein KAW45_02830 [Thermoplasmatales archaeon]|nr:hypothetical protein [Thermoplasmatales archaeon]
MCRGLGRVERAILENLKEMCRSYFTYLWTLTKDVCGYDINTDPSMIERADYNKVSRACISLEKKGYVKSTKIPRIQHPPPDYNSTKVPPPKHVRNWHLERKIIWLETDSPNCPSSYFL